MDFRGPTNFKFSGTLSSSLEGLNQEGQWVLEQTAKSIARSLVFPCKVDVQGTDEARELVGGEEGANLPNPVACLVFDWKNSKLTKRLDSIPNLLCTDHCLT